jgi:hypothetical protein
METVDVFYGGCPPIEVVRDPRCPPGTFHVMDQGAGVKLYAYPGDDLPGDAVNKALNDWWAARGAASAFSEGKTSDELFGEGESESVIDTQFGRKKDPDT